VADAPGWAMNVRPGQVLVLTADQYDFSQGPLRLRVIRVLDHLSPYYGGEKIWIEGVRLDERGLPIENMQVLVRTDAITDGRPEV
jgi:hypothetical protein